MTNGISGRRIIDRICNTLSGRLMPLSEGSRCEMLEGRVLLSGQVASTDITVHTLASNSPFFLPLASLRSVSTEIPAVLASAYTPFGIALDELKANLLGAAMEFTPDAASNPLVLSLPRPDGTMAEFQIAEAPVMEPGLAAQFPDIKTYRGQGIDDPTASLRMDYTSLGFHAQVLSALGSYYIDPYYLNDASGTYVSYYKRDLTSADTWQCDDASDPALDGIFADALPANALAPSIAYGSTLRTFRTAVAADGEYVAAVGGGTVSGGQAAVVTAMNRVTGVYETELDVRLVLVANNSSIIYTNAATDPYSNTNASKLLRQNQNNLDAVIGDANYDIGHVFTTGGGGLAALGVVGRSGLKAQAETGLPNPVGDAYYIDYVAHEMGHQFGANHTFNTANDTANRNASTAYEPGSGSTIMAYAGIEGSDDLQPHSDPYFHSASIDEIRNYLATIPSVGTSSSTGNSAPTVSAGSAYIIPARTPFVLTATGSDPNGDVVTYDWQERDLGVATFLTTPDNGSSPILRDWVPSTNPSRTIPRLSDLVNNTLAPGEMLPGVSRAAFNWRVIARDNRAGGGGVSTSDVSLSVVDTGAAFAVTTPNTAVSWPAGSSQAVTWNVAGTTVNGINTANVRILLSTDGGLTYPIVLSSSTANDGSQLITLPNITTATARVRVEAVGNIFFDISNTNFTITPANVNQTPTDITLSASSIPENQPSGTAVGTLGTVDPDAGNTFTYSLVSGTGSTDNTSFAVSGNTLQTAAIFDFEAKNSYSIRLRTTDQGGLWFEKAFTISVTNVNETPTDIALSSSTIPENQPVGAAVGTLSTVDPDAGNTFTYSLVSGIGSTDNTSFTISGNTLQTAAIFDSEVKSSYSIRLRTTDQGGLWFEKTFTIGVTNVNETPTDIALSSSTIPENEPSGTAVGSLSTTDPDTGNTFTYSLVSGTGSTDNASFTISGNTLQTAAIFDYETKNSYSIRVRSTDQGGLWYEKTFTVSVLNVAEVVPTITGISTDTGSSSSDGITSDSTLLINGTSEPGMTITVYRGGVLAGTTSANGSGNWVFDYTGTSLSDGSYSFTATASDTLGHTTAASAPYAVTIDTAAPTVTAVYVKGSTWNANFLSFLAGNLSGSSSTYGFAIPVGSGDTQLQTLPWRNLNQISVAFSEDVSVAQAQFAIVGSVGSYSVSGFAYNSTDHVATLSISAVIGADKLYVALPGSGTTPVTDTAGNALDGEWTNPTGYNDAGPTSIFPSGNGVAGGDFAFRLDVLPGDSTGGSLGKVNVADINQTKSRSSLPETTSSYRSDFDGNDLVNVADINYVKSRSSISSLPVDPPVLPTFGPTFFSVSLLWRGADSLLGKRSPGLL